MTHDYPEAEMERLAEQAGEKLPPHDLPSERAVLGCVLLDSSTAMPECVLRLKFGAETFYDLKNRDIYLAMLELYELGTAVDAVTLANWLNLMGNLEAVGGYAYLNSLPETVPSASNVSYYLAIIVEKAQLRKVIVAGTELVARAFEQSGNVTEMVAQAHGTLLDLATQTDENPEKTMHGLIQESLVQLDMWHQRGGELVGLSTGLPDLDGLTSGLQRADMIVLAARPGLGKTSLAMNIVDHVAVEVGQCVGVFSLEMTARSLALRMVSARAGVDLGKARKGFLTESDFGKLGAASARLNTAPIWIDDTSGLTILQLRTRARQMKKKRDIKLLVIDYLQLMTSPGGRQDNRQVEVARISCGIKQIAKELDIPVIILCQLNRDIERDKSRAPRLSDIRESGSVEADADVVLFLWQKPGGGDAQRGPHDGVAIQLEIAKHRNGPTGVVPVMFFKHIVKFMPSARVESGDVPQQPSPPASLFNFNSQSADP